MQTKELRKKLHQMIDMADERIIESRLRQLSKNKSTGNEEVSLDDVMAVIVEMLHSHETEIIAYTAQGAPLTKDAFVKRIDEAMAQVANGEAIDFEDFEKESESW